MIRLEIDKIRAALVISHGGVSENSTDGQCRILWDMLTDEQRQKYLRAVPDHARLTEQPAQSPDELTALAEPEPEPEPEKPKTRQRSKAK